MEYGKHNERPMTDENIKMWYYLSVITVDYVYLYIRGDCENFIATDFSNQRLKRIKV